MRSKIAMSVTQVWIYLNSVEFNGANTKESLRGP